MRIAIHTQYYPPEIGAPQARLSALAKRLAERGHEVFTLTAMPNYPTGRIYSGYGGLIRREKRDGVTIIRSYIYPTNSRTVRSRLASAFSFTFFSLMAGAFALSKLDFLLTESPPPFLGFTGFLLSKLKGARWILNIADLWLEGAVRLNLVHEGIGVKMVRAMEKFFYKRAWLVTGQTREILERITQCAPGVETYHFSNGVDTRRFHPRLRSREFRIGVGNDQDCIAVYAGLHGIAQGLDQVLRAAARLRDMKNLRFVLIGDGPEKKRLVEQAQLMKLENVQFLSPCSHEVMPAILASADIALVPLRDRFAGAVPSKLYEAMGVGLPVVMAAAGEARDILQNANAGVVVPPGNDEALANALRFLAYERDKGVEMGKNGRQAAVSLFDRQAIADRFIDLLECAAGV